MQAPDELTVVYNLNDPAVNSPALLTIQSSNNVMQSPTAWKTKGDDYNRNPVGTGPYILKSWTAGDRMVLERNPDYWNKGHPYLDRIVAEAAAGCAVALRQPAIRRSRYRLGR